MCIVYTKNSSNPADVDLFRCFPCLFCCAHTESCANFPFEQIVSSKKKKIVRNFRFYYEFFCNLRKNIVATVCEKNETKMLTQRQWAIGVIVSFVAIAVQCDNFGEMSRPKTISELQIEYLSNEENLWKRIDGILFGNASVNSDVQMQANETWIEALKLHQIVFFGDTFDINSYWRSYLLFRIANFRDYLSNINSTLEENYRYLFDDNNNNQIHFDPANIELWTRDSMFQHLKENSDGLFNLTVIHTDTVLKHIQNVSKNIAESERKHTHKK